MPLSGRSFTHRDRKDRSDHFGLCGPSVAGSSVPLRSLRSPCECLFPAGVLHTEIAKIVQTISDCVALRFRGRLFLCVLCDLRVNASFRPEFYTQRSQRSFRPFRTVWPFGSGVVCSFAFFAISV